jgi:cell division protein YceG involved in septum cleavage
MKRILLAIILLAILTAGFTGFWGYRQLNAPVRHAKQGSYIEIPRGSSPTAIINKRTTSYSAHRR